MLPKDIQLTLWSYDVKKIDPQKHKKTIIGQVLNWGNKRAIDWLFKYYGKEQIAKVASQIPLGQWDKKSLALWSLILKISPKERKERIA